MPLRSKHHHLTSDPTKQADEERKDSLSSDLSNDPYETTEQSTVELTSNLAFDRFLSLGAQGYSNGMIKLMRVNTLKDEVSQVHTNK